MSSSCPRQSALELRHDGGLAADERQELESHLQACAECQAYAQRLLDLDRTISGMVRESEVARPARRRPLRWTIAMVALAALMAGSVGVVLLLASPDMNPSPDKVEATQAISLAFRIKISLPVEGKERIVEATPKVVVLNDKKAEIAMEIPGSGTLKVTARPTLGKRRQVTLSINLTCQIGKAEVSRKLRMITQLGSPAMVEIEDQRRGEKLAVEVTPSRAPR